MTGGSRFDGPEKGGGVTVAFGPKYAESEQFKAVFREGMALVEAAAAYLDGDGRRHARGLSPAAALAYATESMRLTTRLMQLASWLLIRRALNEGELTAEQAKDEQQKVKLKPVVAAARSPAHDELPERLKYLIEASLKLHRRILRLDAMMQPDHPRQVPGHSPLSVQLEWLRIVFEKRDRTRSR
jgi:regulator of CtrA degradation